MARPSIRLITVDAGVIRQAEKAIESCEHCRPHDAEIPVDWILRDVKGSIRRECLDHVIVVGEESLRCALRSYFAYYHRARLHLSLDGDSPDSRSVQSVGEIVAIPEVGGLHHWYQRFAA